MAFHCPECGGNWNNKRCGSCGHTAGGGKDGADPDWRLCANVEFGQRCANAGTHSHSTRGGGPWLCWQHLTSQRSVIRREANMPAPEVVQHIRDVVKREAPDRESDREREAMRDADL